MYSMYPAIQLLRMNVPSQDFQLEICQHRRSKTQKRATSMSLATALLYPEFDANLTSRNPLKTLNNLDIQGTI